MTMSEEYLDGRMVTLLAERERLENELQMEGVLPYQKNQKRATIAQINRAIKRIDLGNYGFCVEKDCHKEIPRGRLENVAHAERCVECQRALENKTKKSHAL
jgi:RNA polymerase-binding transcription factor DksA